MRLEYNLQQPNFSVVNVDILNVSRPKITAVPVGMAEQSMGLSILYTGK